MVLAGKSMGSRMGCHVSLEEPVVCLVCFGYPLRAAGSGKLRDAVLLELSTPILFVQGTRDELCPLDDLEKVRARMNAANEALGRGRRRPLARDHGALSQGAEHDAQRSGRANPRRDRALRDEAARGYQLSSSSRFAVSAPRRCGASPSLCR